MSEQQTLIRDANVSVIKQFDKKHRPLAAITVEGEYTHIFPHTSRVSKHLDVMEADDLASRLSGGSYFFIENQLIDFRDGSYNGFIHEDKTISVFMEILGYQQKTDLQLAHMQKNKRDDIQSPIVLRKVWDKNEISVPGYSGGADFDSVLSFTWNPYVKTINTVFDLVRLICTNGMVGLTSFLNTKVPVVNRFDTHLDIAARQVQNKVNDIVIQRVQQMTLEHCSVSDLLLLEDHTMSRLSQTIDNTEHQMLLNVMNAISPRAQLANVYRESVFNDKNLAAQLPGHLSNFDVFNVATQLRTHTQETSKSTDFALDKISNGILFDKQDNFNASSGRLTAPSMKSFNDPEMAYFGMAA